LLQTPTIVGLAQTIEAIQSQNAFTETSSQEYEEDYL
jgi:hypothetical protein